MSFIALFGVFYLNFNSLLLSGSGSSLLLMGNGWFAESGQRPKGRIIQPWNHGWTPGELSPRGRSTGYMAKDFDVPGGPNDPDGPQAVVADIYLLDRNQIDGSAFTSLPLGVENDLVAPSD